MLRIDEDIEKVCGRTGYFGEDGSRDAYEGLMAVLAHRMRQPAAPLEPWAVWTSNRPSSAAMLGEDRDTLLRKALDKASLDKKRKATKAKATVDASWYQARREWYALQVKSEDMSLIQPHAPAQQHRRALAAVLGFRRHSPLEAMTRLRKRRRRL